MKLKIELDLIVVTILAFIWIFTGRFFEILVGGSLLFIFIRLIYITRELKRITQIKSKANKNEV